MTDDFLDNADTRYGVPCWYKLDDVNKKITNDVILLWNGIFVILKKYFSNHHCYVPIIELFHEITLKTSMGQVLDSLSSSPQNGPNFEIFTIDKYNAIAKYKTPYLGFILPTATAMYLANLYDSRIHQQMRSVSIKIGVFYQVQDDFINCFGDPGKTGKDSNDIREGKCTWLSVVALQLANSQQRKIMEEYYGRPDVEANGIIKHLYEDLNLPNIYAEYEEESYNNICEDIEKLPKGLQLDFLALMDKIFKRTD